MNFEKNLRLLEIGKEFDVIKIDDKFEISLSNLTAVASEKGKIKYYVTGVYNSGDDYEEIDIEKLELLKEFVSLLGDE